MLAEFIVMFRESLEVAFILGIILTYLYKTKNQEFEKHVWLGAAAGLVISIALAYLFQFIKGGFEENEELFEGTFMVISAVLVTSFAVWVLKQKKIVETIQGNVKMKLEKNETFGLFLLSIAATLREGVEAVLFMAGIYLNTGAISLIGGFLGIAAAVLVGVLVFEYAMKFNMGQFFRITTIILVLLAAGLFSQGLHELQEANVLPVIWTEHVYTLPFDTSNPLHEKGAIGSILKGLLGYDTGPSDLQVLGYVAYLAAVYIYYKKT